MDRTSRIQQVVQEYLRHCPADEDAQEEQLRAHPDLMPELGDRLRKLQLIMRAGARARQPFPLGLGADDALPDRFGKYEVVALLGRGGQALTYKAFDPDLQRHVVLKLYHTAETEAEREAILMEGRALARVRSRYVAQCHGVERHQGAPYLVVEYVPGKNLAQVQQAAPVGLDRALELTAQVAEGLAAVHACGLLHRDVKPSNIVVGDDDLPRLVDFGLAAPLGDATLQHASGTLPYMPPEQARGEVERVGPASDLFGLGAVLYSLLTGGPPYRGRTSAKLWQAVCAGDVVPARTRNPALPTAVDALCRRCLAKDPTARFASAADFIAAVRRCRHSWYLRLWAAGAAAALVILLSTAVAAWWSGSFHDWRTGGQDANTSTPNAGAAGDIPRHPDGRALRQDFPIQVELIGTRKDPSGRRHQITEGQWLSLRIEVPHDCYVGVWYENDEGMILQLFPNLYDAQNLIAGGTPCLIPGDKAYAIQAKPSKAPGRMHICASTEPWASVEGSRIGHYVVFASPEERERLHVLRRNFEVVARGKAVSEVVLEVQVVPPR